MKAKPVQDWQCGGCGVAYPSKEVADQCCLCSTCGAERIRTYCKPCREEGIRKRIAACERVQPDDYEQFGNEDNTDFTDWDGIVDREVDAAFEGYETGTWHPCVLEPVKVDATRVIESFTGDWQDELTDQIYKHEATLQKALDEWVKSTGITQVWFPDDSKVIDEATIAKAVADRMETT